MIFLQIFIYTSMICGIFFISASYTVSKKSGKPQIMTDEHTMKLTDFDYLIGDSMDL